MLKKFFTLASLLFLAAPTASALQMPQNVDELLFGSNFTAQSYLVMDNATGQVLFSKNEQKLWPPASLTKLVTAMVFLDTKPNMNKVVIMKKTDEVGGVRLSTKSGVSYRLKDLFSAALIASANNAATAVARSTGLTPEEFVAKMNQKARDLGATNTLFLEPTGMSERNVTTASDFAKIVKAAYALAPIRASASLNTYNFGSTNNKRYYHKLKNTNKRLQDSELATAVGKTGYLDESRYNFAAEIQDRLGNDLIIVLLGSQDSAAQFKETKELAFLGSLAKSFFSPLANIFGTSTLGTTINN